MDDMKEYSIFDIIGPAMIGPSSSHTAGAARLGYMARKIAGSEIREVTFYLHGSFAQTYKGHGTDKALLAGIVGLLPDDAGIKRAFDLAREKAVDYKFLQADLGEVHPNTVNMIMKMASGEEYQVMGSSIGGGKIKIIQINGMDVDFDGEYTTLITYHLDFPGVVANITAILAKYNVNIAFMRLFRETKGSNARLIVETDENIEDTMIKEIIQSPHVVRGKVIRAI